MRQALVALGAVLLLAGCTRPASPSTQPTVTSAVVIPPSDDDLASVVPLEAEPELRSAARPVTVLRVVDGDTLDVNPGKERVRPLTVNTPELHVYEPVPRPPDCGAEAARDALSALLPVGTPVLLLGLPGEPATDDTPHHRTLANVYVERDGRLVNVSLWLVEQGWAVTLKSYPTVETERAEALQAQAQAAHRGMWVNCPERS